MTKRLFDIVLSVLGLLLVSPLLLLAAVAIKVESPGPVLFVQERIGRGMQPFRIYKLRTMYKSGAGPDVTRRGDARVTRVGRVLRATKIDEIPQLVNVIMGEMSLVGPRPEIAGYVEMFREDFSEILQLRPGMTGLASLRHRDEEGILAESDDPGRTYCEEILPDKLRLERIYLRRQSFCLDARLILDTVLGRRGPSLAETRDEGTDTT